MPVPYRDRLTAMPLLYCERFAAMLVLYRSPTAAMTVPYRPPPLSVLHRRLTLATFSQIIMHVFMKTGEGGRFWSKASSSKRPIQYSQLWRYSQVCTEPRSGGRSVIRACQYLRWHGDTARLVAWYAHVRSEHSPFARAGKRLNCETTPACRSFKIRLGGDIPSLQIVPTSPFSSSNAERTTTLRSAPEKANPDTHTLDVQRALDV